MKNIYYQHLLHLVLQCFLIHKLSLRNHDNHYKHEVQIYNFKIKIMTKHAFF